MDYKNYSFYKGEEVCPFSDFGKAFWWRVESYSAEQDDDKKPERLSPVMFAYLKSHMWEGDAQPTTSLVEFKKRATALYLRGAWSRNYVTQRCWSLEQGLGENV